jgi:hypothetical protein
MKTISLSLKELEVIVEAAKAKIKKNDDLNGYLEIVVCDTTRYHGHSDSVKVYAQSKWAECDSSLIYQRKEL